MADREDDFSRLFRREYPRLVRQVVLVVGDIEEAKQVAQEALGRLYADWARLSQLERPGAWARQVASRGANQAA